MQTTRDCTIAGKLYCRHPRDDGTFDYTVQAVSGFWRYLDPRRAAKIIARIDAALDNPQTSG